MKKLLLLLLISIPLVAMEDQSPSRKRARSEDSESQQPERTRRQTRDPILERMSLPFLCNSTEMEIIQRTRAWEIAKTVHSSYGAHECPICNKKIRGFRKNLAHHLCRHTGEKPFHCSHPGCTYSCIQASNLNAHMYTHGGRFMCTQSERETLQRTRAREIAQKVQSSGGYYECPICSKKIKAGINYLIYHLCIHTGEKPFHCPHPGCTYSCIQLVHLRTHMYTHSGERLFI